MSYTFSKQEVLVDVDDTLFHPGTNRYNNSLIDALVKRGIREISLFTSMTAREALHEISDPRYISRPQLIEYLRTKGIHVKAVISPADASYGKGLGAAYNDLYLPLHRRIANGELTENNYSTDKEYRDNEDQYREFHNQTFDSRAPIHRDSIKGPLYRYFLNELEKTTNPPTTSVLFIDDREN